MNDVIERKALPEFTEQAYLDYSMYVILDRALPHLADGFKPVQRRIVYAMSELGLKASAKHKKSARTVGDVLGKFHPHGDSACYEAMVLMAQPFSYRYPLIDGQGNWGSPDDPKSFAAMRYTEARLSPYSDILLSELPQGTVDWVDNFDATLLEPSLLPARLPNVLLNGATGIAVGMSCDVLPHNLCEVANACIHLLDHKEATLDDLLHYIQGPDFPTSAEIITPASQIRQLYETGLGSIKMRAVYTMEENQVVITALPYQVSGAKVIEQIAEQLQQKKLPMVEDIRDESDHEHPTRLVIVPRSNRVDLDNLMLHLFATTDLERSYRANFNVIGLNGKPEVKPLLPLLQEWISFRLATVKRRLEFKLAKLEDRIHILEGLLIAFLNIDEVIHIIRQEDEPKPVLMQRFQLSERQAEAILEIKLRHLAKLEEIKLKGELAECCEERDLLQNILASERKLKALVKNEIATDRDRFGNERLSALTIRQGSQALKEEDVIPNEPVTVVLSQKGWIRAAKGHEIAGDTLSYKASDNYLAETRARSNQTIVFFDSFGKVYSLPAHTLPSARGQGEPLTGKLNPEEGAVFSALISGNPTDFIGITSTAGYGFLTPLEELYVKNRNGKHCLKLPAEAAILPPIRIEDRDNDELACVSNLGRLLVFPIKDLPILAKGKGNKLMHLSHFPEEYLVSCLLIKPSSALIIQAGKRNLKIKYDDLTTYRGERGKRGKLLPRGLHPITGLAVE